MFAECYHLMSVEFGNFDTSSVVNMSSMFNSVRNNLNLNLSLFNTSRVTDMEEMFALFPFKFRYKKSYIYHYCSENDYY